MKLRRDYDSVLTSGKECACAHPVKSTIVRDVLFRGTAGGIAAGTKINKEGMFNCRQVIILNLYVQYFYKRTKSIKSVPSALGMSAVSFLY